MALHHKIKPRHHVSIWIVAVLVFIGSLVAYNSVTIGVILADNGPSATTKKFFGFNDDNGQGQKWVAPAVCQQNPAQTQMQALSAQMQQLQQQQQQLLQQLQQSGSQNTNQSQQQAQLQTIQQQMTDIQNQMKSLQSQMQQGPSDDCKKAIITQAISQMQAQQAKMFAENRLTGTLDKVDSVIAKIEADISSLQAAGVSADNIASIKDDIAAIKADNAILRNFFEQMKSQMANFIAQAQADPLGTFDKMQHGNGPMNQKDGTNAANAADGMVSHFTSMVSILDKITGTVEGQ